MSWITNRHHTNCTEVALSAASSASTAGSARPSLSPDSRFSEWRTMRGTRGFVTMLEVSTGSVGESRAPIRKDSVQENPISSVRGDGDDRRRDRHRQHELAHGQTPLALEHLALDLQPVAKQDHDQRDERQILDEARAGAEVDPAETTRADHEAGQHEQGGEGQERALRQPRQERTEDQQQAQRGGGRLECGHTPIVTFAAAARTLPPRGRILKRRTAKLSFGGGGPTMAAKDRSSGGSGFGKAGEAARAARSNRYVERLFEDEELRGSLLAAYGAARSAYGRMSNGKPATTALFEDRKLQNELREAAGALRDAANTLREPPRKARKRRGGLPRKLLLLGIAGVLALALSEDLRGKVLDLLFGAEEEFEYSSTTAPAEPVPASASAS